MDLLTAQTYYDELAAAIPEAHNRILINAMNVSWNGKTAPLAESLMAALTRNVQVTIVGDAYTRLDDSLDRISGNRHIHKGWRQTETVSRQLQEAGARVTYLGKLGLNPFKGRCHTKITVIDDTAYAFGGVNFFDKGFGFQDYMLRSKDPLLADSLGSLVVDIARGRLPDHDMATALDEHNTLLFDVGTPGKSIIYDEACGLVERARNVWCVTQYPPSGRLSDALRAIGATCYFNRLQSGLGSLPANMSIMLDNLRRPIKNQYDHKKYLHAKCILAEMPDGSKQLLTGSHNFSYRGVRYGTKEIALRSSDEGLWQQLYEFIQKEIA